MLHQRAWASPLVNWAPPRTGNRDLRGSPSNSYACRDGFVNVLVTNDRRWAGFVRIMNRVDLD